MRAQQRDMHIAKGNLNLDMITFPCTFICSTRSRGSGETCLTPLARHFGILWSLFMVETLMFIYSINIYMIVPLVKISDGAAHWGLRGVARLHRTRVRRKYCQGGNFLLPETSIRRIACGSPWAEGCITRHLDLTTREL